MSRPISALRAQSLPANQTLARAGWLAVSGVAVAGAIIGVASRTGVGLVWYVPFAGVGTLLIIRRPRTSIGWILLGLGWAGVIVTGTIQGTVRLFADATYDIPTQVFAVLHGGSGAAAYYALAALAIVFPSGRLPSGPWGVPTRVALAVGLILVAAAFVMPVINVSLVGYPAPVQVRNPIALFPDLAVWKLITPDTAFFPVVMLVIAAAVSLLVRVRRSRGTERQQLRWITASITSVAVAVVCGFAIGMLVPGSSETGLAWIPVILAVPTVPVAIGIAILRYRLYEIDRIVSRTIAYAVVTAILALTYGAIVLLLQTALARFTGGDVLAVAGSTLAVATVAQPVLGRVRRTVDQRFDRARYDATGIVAELTDRLRDEVDLSSLRGEIVATIGRALHPATATMWLRGR